MNASDSIYPTQITQNTSGLTKREELIFRIAAELAGKYGFTNDAVDIAAEAIRIADGVISQINEAS